MAPAAAARHPVLRCRGTSTCVGCDWNEPWSEPKLAESASELGAGEFVAGILTCPLALDFSASFGEFMAFRSLKNSLLSTNGFVLPVPRGSRSVNS